MPIHAYMVKAITVTVSKNPLILLANLLRCSKAIVSYVSFSSSFAFKPELFTNLKNRPEKGLLVKMVRATTVYQDHHAPQTTSSACPCPEPTRLIVAIVSRSGTMSSGQPPWAWLTIIRAHLLLCRPRSSSRGQHVHTYARQQRQTASQHWRHRARRG